MAPASDADGILEFLPQDTRWDEDGLVGDPSNDGSLLITRPTETLLGSGTLTLINLGIETG